MCFSVCRFSQYLYTHVLVFRSIMPLCVCLSVPRRNHQKHPRGSGDDNLWSLVLSACCHRLGYEGSRDPHRISERGKHAMLHLSKSLTLIKHSHAVRCKKRCWKYLCCNHYFLQVVAYFFGQPELLLCHLWLFHHHLTLCDAVACRPLCWINYSKLLESSLGLD